MTVAQELAHGPTVAHAATKRLVHIAVNTAVNGTPAMARPTPPSTDWSTAVTTTPSATLRIAWPASRTDCSPRSPASRCPKRRATAAARSPPIYMMAAMTTVSRN